MRLLILGLFCLIYYLDGKPNGTPKEACFYMTPRHIHPHTYRKVFPTKAMGLYNITTSADVFRPDRPIRVTLWGPPFKGFMMVAAEEGAKDWPTGIFYSEDGSSKSLSCLGRGDSVTHQNNSYKDSVSVLWYGPENMMSEQIQFIATVVVNLTIYYTDIKSGFLRLDPSLQAPVGAEGAAGGPVTMDPWLAGNTATRSPWNQGGVGGLGGALGGLGGALGGALGSALGGSSSWSLSSLLGGNAGAASRSSGQSWGSGQNNGWGSSQSSGWGPNNQNSGWGSSQNSGWGSSGQGSGSNNWWQERGSGTSSSSSSSSGNNWGGGGWQQWGQPSAGSSWGSGSGNNWGSGSGNNWGSGSGNNWGSGSGSMPVQPSNQQQPPPPTVQTQAPPTAAKSNADVWSWNWNSNKDPSGPTPAKTNPPAPTNPPVPATQAPPKSPAGGSTPPPGKWSENFNPSSISTNMWAKLLDYILGQSSTTASPAG